MSKSRTFRTMGLSFLCIALLAGCWDRNEINDLAMVMASGLDLADNGQVEVTLQIALPAGSGSSMGTGNENKKSYLVISSSGADGIEALHKMQEQLSRKIYLAHRGVMIIGEAYARHGIDQILDEFSRSPESRTDSFILTTHGATAKEILQIPYLMEQIPGIGIRKMQFQGISLAVRLNEFLSSLPSDEKYPVTGSIRILKNPDSGIGFRIDEAAVYAGHRLVGFLSEKEVKKILWMRGKIKRIPFTIEVEPKEAGFKGTINVETLRKRVRIHTKIRNGRPEATMVYQMAGRIKENDTTLDLSMTENLKLVERKLADSIQKVIIGTVRHVQQQYKADIFGFGREVHIEHPYYWKTNKERWQDIYSHMKVNVEVHVAVERVGRTKEPAHLKSDF